jgi:hypothetical protein
LKADIRAIRDFVEEGRLMRTTILSIAIVVATGLAGCKSDAGSEAPKLSFAAELDPIATGSLPPPSVPGLEPGVEAWYRERGAIAPTGDRIGYCHGYGCEFHTPIDMGDEEMAALTRIFDAHKATPAEERIAVNLADQWWEKRADKEIGAPPDVRGSDLAHAHVPGQTDCLDEATNTTTLLAFLERKGLLRYHHVLRPESRGAFLYAHATAVMRDKTTGIDWIADSWMRDSGDPIDVMTLEEWFSRAYVDPES